MQLFNNIRSVYGIRAVLLVASMAGALPIRADVYPLTFNEFETEQQVGSGVFSFNGHASNGTFELNNLPNFNFDFTLGSSNFTTEELQTPISDIAVLLSNGSVYFSSVDTSGPAGASVEFNGPNNQLLLFTPEGNSAFVAIDSSGFAYLGTYSAAPEPGYGLIIAGLALVFVPWRFAIRRRT